MVRVQSAEKAQLIVDLCNEHGWQVIAGVEEDEPEDASDVEKLVMSLNETPKVAAAPIAPPQISGNDYCPCRSGKKYKKCCGAPGSPSSGGARRASGPRHSCYDLVILLDIERTRS